jgi:multicomponent Na+:H+ antiporter subunit F
MTFLSIAATMAGGMLATAAFLSFIRLVKGPALPDRVVALDLITTLTVAAIVVYTIATNQKSLLDATLVVALVAFLATVAFARYLERRARND